MHKDMVQSLVHGEPEVTISLGGRGGTGPSALSQMLLW